MEKLVCGKITLYRLQCPSCNEFNLSESIEFSCDCGNKYSKVQITKTRILAITKRKNPSQILIKKLLIEQDNRCIYCNRKFGAIYYRNYKVRKLYHCADHQIPFSYLQNNPDINFVLACNLCNSFKQAKIFESIEDSRKYLIHKLDKEISQGKLEILD